MKIEALEIAAGLATVQPQLSVKLPAQGVKSNEKYWRVMTNLAWFYRGFC
jgi:hypothetical protein